MCFECVVFGELQDPDTDGYMYLNRQLPNGRGVTHRTRLVDVLSTRVRDANGMRKLCMGHGYGASRRVLKRVRGSEVDRGVKVVVVGLGGLG